MAKNFAESYREVAPYTGLGIQLAATIGGMTWLGWWLDEKFETKPWLLIAFAMFGGFAGIFNFIKTVIELGKKKDVE